METRGYYPLGTLIILRYGKWGSAKSPILAVPAVSTVDKQAIELEVTWKKRKTMTIVCIRSNFDDGVSSLMRDIFIPE
jgi:hypothetical protein